MKNPLANSPRRLPLLLAASILFAFALLLFRTAPPAEHAPASTQGASSASTAAKPYVAATTAAPVESSGPVLPATSPAAQEEPFNKVFGPSSYEETEAGELARLMPGEAGRVPGLEAEEDEDEDARPDRPDEADRWRTLTLVDEKGIIPEGALVRAWEQARSMPVDPRAWPNVSRPEGKGTSEDYVAGIQRTGWSWLGPGNIGGRIRSIIIDPTNPLVMYVGSVAGGIWKTTNGGVSWAPLDDFMANLAVSCMVMDPTNPNVIYAGTGEGYGNSDTRRGAGIFVTTDAGTTWNRLASTNNSSFFFVNRLAISPANNQVMLAATSTGIWRTADGGATWSNRTPIAMLDINFNPADASKAIASGTNGAGARYSVDGGLTWTVATGISASGRVEVAYARSNPAITYASVNVNSGEVWRSTDGGQTYTLANTGKNYLGSQGWYDNALWVDPTNPDIVIVGGIDLWRSTDGGVNFTQISRWQSAPSLSAHADNHVIVESPQFNGTTNTTVFFGNDGGIYRALSVYTVATTAGWLELNNNLGITQFYSGAGNPATGRIVGGTQDNGTLRFTGNTEAWNTPFGGDGGWSAADPTDGNYFYGEYVYLQIHRSTNGGLSSNYIYTGITDAGSSSTANFISPFILDPNNPNTMLAGAAQLWRSKDVKSTSTPPTWASIKPSTGSNISAIAVAKGNSDIIWVGHNSGDVYFTSNGTSDTPTWTQVDLNSPALPNRFCTRITIDPTNSSRVYVTFGGFSADNVWRTNNSGANWTNITSNLPAVPVRSLVVWQTNPNYLYVGTEIGVFASADGGLAWSPSNDGPTNCSVDELFWMNNTLVAATHGRGMFSIAISTGQPPTVSITSPLAGASFAAPASIPVTATAGDTDGSVTQVEFFANGSLIGTDTTAPYTATLSNAAAGSYVLTARATDNSGDTAVSGTVNVTVTGGTVLANDNFASAQAISGCSGSVNGTTTGATEEPSEPSHDEAGSPGGGSVWYQYTATSNGTLTINTTGSRTNFDTVLAVYTGTSLGGLSVVGKNDDAAAGTTTSALSFPVTAGVTYKIAVDGWNGSSGNFVLNWSQTNCSASVQLSLPAYSVAEGGSFATVTVTRTGDTSVASTVKYQTSDTTTVNFQCNPNTAGQITGQASRKCDYHLASGRLRFAAGETSKQIILSVVDDAYVEGPETFTITLSAATGAALGAVTTATVTITDNDILTGANPIDGTHFFVRQLYVDLLSREPDQAGWDGWTSRIDLCGQPGQAPPPCDRVTVGGDGFLRSSEFFDRQFFVLRLYRTGFGRILQYSEVGDLAYVSGFLSAADLELNKQELVAEIMTRSEFTTKYNGLTNASFVDTLLQTAAVTVTQSVRDAWVTSLGNSTKTRAQVFREISERAEVSNKYLTEAQVVSAYYGFFTRNPDGAYLNYLQRLNSGEINLGDLANAFINAAEYRQRFGP